MERNELTIKRQQCTLFPCLHVVKEFTFQLISENIQCPVCLEECRNEQLMFPSAIPSDILNKFLNITSRMSSCEMCIDRNPAVSYCKDCDSLLDDFCTINHQKIKLWLMHSVIGFDKNNVRDLSITNFIPKSFCSNPDHERKLLDIFCERCEILMCAVCRFKHSSDHNCITIEDASGPRQQLLVQMKNNLVEKLGSLNERELIQKFQHSVKFILDLLECQSAVAIVQQTSAVQRRFQQLLQIGSSMQQRNEEFEIVHIRSNENQRALLQAGLDGNTAFAFIQGAAQEEQTPGSILYEPTIDNIQQVSEENETDKAQCPEQEVASFQKEIQNHVDGFIDLHP